MASNTAGLPAGRCGRTASAGRLMGPVLALMLAVASLTAACTGLGRSGPPPGTSPERGAAAPVGSPAPSPATDHADSKPGSLPDPVIYVGWGTWSGRHAPGDTLLLPVREESPSHVQVRWGQKLDLESTRGRIDAQPASALEEVSWDQGTSAEGENWAQASLRLAALPPGQSAEVTVRAGVRGLDGRVLDRDLHFRVVFVEATRVEITVRGPGYLPSPGGGPGEVVASSRAAAGTGPAVFRPGSAELTLTFSRPAGRQAVEAALRAQLSQAGLAERVRLRRFSWDEAGKKLTVAMDQAAGQHGIFIGLQQPYVDLREVLDAQGLPIDPEGTELRWLVARPVPVFRSAGLPAGTDAAGQVAALYDLQPAGPGALRGSRLLTWHRAGDEPECGTVQLVLWDLPGGTAVPVGPPGSGCGAWAAWEPGGDVIVAGVNGVTRYAVGRDEVLPEPGRLAPETLYRVPEGRIVVGMAVAPDGKVVVFEATPPRAPGGAAGAVDLVLVDLQGKVGERLEGVSDLTVTESVWRTVQASWSADGTVLAFTRYRLGTRPGPEGNGPTAVTASLSLWRPGAARVEELDVPAGAVSWRPGTGQVLVRAEGGWKLYDVENRTPVPVPVKLPEAAQSVQWSADGHYALWLGRPDGSGVLDLQTGARKQGEGLLPLGWNPADGKLYWIAGRSG